MDVILFKFTYLMEVTYYECDNNVFIYITDACNPYISFLHLEWLQGMELDSTWQKLEL